MSPSDSLMISLGRQLGLTQAAIWGLLLLPSILVSVLGIWVREYIARQFRAAELRQANQYEQQIAKMTDALRFGTEKRLTFFETRLKVYADLVGTLAEDIVRAKSEDGELLLRVQAREGMSPEAIRDASINEQRIQSLQVERLRLIRELGRLSLLVHAFEGEGDLANLVDDCIQASPFVFGGNAPAPQRADRIAAFEGKVKAVNEAVSHRIREDVELIERGATTS